MTEHAHMGGSDALFDLPPTLQKSAALSDCGRYRYDLIRCWSAEPRGSVIFVGLNPSTADAEQDDPTIRRCIGFAKSWGYAALHMLNLFAWRATDPVHLHHADDPVGPENDEYLRTVCYEAGSPVIAAWGAHPLAVERARHVVPMLGPRLSVLGLTRSGAPRHPLYMKASCTPIPWDAA